MIQLNFTQSDIDELNYLRFHHPDPIVMKRCETVYLKAGAYSSSAWKHNANQVATNGSGKCQGNLQTVVKT